MTGIPLTRRTSLSDSILVEFRLVVLLMLLAILFLPAIASSEFPELRTYYITCDPDSLDHILENYEEDIYISCQFVYEGRIWYQPRLRIRGDSSRKYDKKSLKVNFDADERFGYRDKVNLNAEWLDPTFCREYLSYDMFRRAGLNASSAWFAKLYINNEYAGLYLDVEQVDEHFLTQNSLDNGSSIYKAVLDGAMLRADENIDSLWTKETNEGSGFYDLYDLVDWIDTVPENAFYDELDTVFDRAQLARHMAVNTLIANSSTYYHNYYLVHDIQPGGFWRILPWDMDRTFRYYWYYGDDNSFPEYYRSSNVNMEEVNALVVRCYTNTQMRDEIFRQVVGMADSLMTDEYYEPMVAHLESLLEDAVMADDNKKFTLDDFRSELNEIPEEVAGRAQYMRNVIESAPHPFTLLPASWSDQNILLSWNSTATPDGSPITYTVEMANHYKFEDAESYEVGTDTSLILTEVPEMPLYWRPIAWGNDYYIRSMQHFEIIADTSEIPDQIVIDPDLFTAYPNPSSGAVRFKFDSAEESTSTLRITNVLGQLVYRITVISSNSAGQSILWSGKDQHGKPVASGMYFCTLERDYGRQTLRIVILK